MRSWSRRVSRICRVPALLFLLSPGIPDVSWAGPPPILRLSSGIADDRFGRAVAPAGDVNGDGVEDLVVPSNNAALVYFGRLGAGMDDVPDVVLSVASPLAFGFAVSTAGDFNADGFSDVLVGEAFAGGGVGLAHVFFGGPAMDGGSDVTLKGMGPGSGIAEVFGSSVAGVGDLNGDGFDDVVVGAPGYGERDPDWTFGVGRAYVFFGSANPDGAADLILEAPPPPDGHNNNEVHFGQAVAPAGDVNRDGRPDFLVYQPRDFSQGLFFGSTFVYHGGPGLDAIPDQSLRSVGSGAGSAERAGTPVYGAGDVNGDGRDDTVVLMSRYTANSSTNADSVYVYFGGTPAYSRTVPDLVLQSAGTTPNFGNSLWGGRDVSGDGYPDIIVGSPYANPDGHRRGRTLVFFGGPRIDELPDEVLDGELDGEWFGYAVSAMDVTGDGIADAVAGAPGSSLGAIGHVYAFDLGAPIPARAFLRDGHRTIPLVDAPSAFRLQLEPLDGAFDPGEVDLERVRLVSNAEGCRQEINAVSAQASVPGDTDANGVPEVTLFFARQDLLQFCGAIAGKQSIPATVEGRTHGGRRIQASVQIPVLGAGRAPRPAASLSAGRPGEGGVLRLAIRERGPVSVRLYDLQGRCVRTLLDRQRFEPGIHSVPFDGRGESGRALASGVYFYRLETSRGESTGRIVIAR